MVYSELINANDFCIMGADEINLEGAGKNPYYITDRNHRIIMKNNPHFNHTSIMFAHFMEGDSLPPFIIFKGLSNEPKEIRVLTQNEQVFVVSNSSGWITEDMFLLWSLFVLSHVSTYRLRHHLKATDTIFLFLDGHGSRASPIALQICCAHFLML